MALYDYKCNSCEDVFEVSHSMNEDPKVLCPSCNSDLVIRLISGSGGIAFKGSGFYVTDKSSKSSSSEKK